MSVVLAASSRRTEENGYGHGPKVTKGSNRTLTQPLRKRGTENPTNPRKTVGAPLPTPRKVLGELSSNTKTPASTVKHKRQSTVQKKPQIRVATKQTKVETKGSKDGTKKPAGTALTSQTHRQGVLKEEELPDIELMPASVGKDHDPPFVAPSYFRNLTAALFNPLPLLGDFPPVGELGSLSLSSDLRPVTKDGPLQVDSFQDLESPPFDKLPPVDMPDIPD